MNSDIKRVNRIIDLFVISHEESGYDTEFIDDTSSIQTSRGNSFKYTLIFESNNYSVTYIIKGPPNKVSLQGSSYETTPGRREEFRHSGEVEKILENASPREIYKTLRQMKRLLQP